MKRTCKQCGKDFFISQQEINFYKEKKLSIPKRCKDCRNANKAAREDAAGDNDNNNSNSNKESTGKNRPSDNKAAGNGKTANKPDNRQKNTGKNTVNPERSADKRNAGAEANKTNDVKNPDKKPLSGAKKAIYSAAAVIILAGSAIFGNQYLNTEPAEPTGYVTEVKASFANERLLNEHYEKHGREMGFASAKEYEAAAARVVADSEALHKTEKEDGDEVYYLVETNEFVIVSKDTGFIRTYFYPSDGIDYYNRQ